MTEAKLILVSACLVGLATRYDGRSRASRSCLDRLAGTIWIPVCPEQLGGLPTPRCAADVTGGDGADVLAHRAAVLAADGTDVTRQFVDGAHMVLAIAERLPITACYLKSRSPSCGVSKPGVTAALLRSKGYHVEEFD